MSEEKRIAELQMNLDELLREQELFSQTLSELQRSLNEVKQGFSEINPLRSPDLETEKVEAKEPQPELQRKIVSTSKKVEVSTPKPLADAPVKKRPLFQWPEFGFNWEKFVGENLINKLGILITILGVGIGVRYTIEHDLIGPTMRIVLGYLLGVVLLIFGFRLKERYRSYSAVLVSGAMAIMYLVTYFAHTEYLLFSQTIAFGLMVLFTIFTVLAALDYDRQVIAIIGLIGAYAVPFLLSNNAGNPIVLFSYVAIVNIGIAAVAALRYWRALQYVSFFATWGIFMSWFAEGLFIETFNQHKVAFIFAAVFFALFYFIFVSYKLRRKEDFALVDILFVIANAFIFFGIGYQILTMLKIGDNYHGLFTLANAIIHFVVAAWIFKYRLGSKQLFYTVVGLVVVFATIAVPIQLDGHWVTLFWATEALVLFWIGRIKGQVFFELTAYALMLCCLNTLYLMWAPSITDLSYPSLSNTIMTPFLNHRYLTGLFATACFGAITHIHFKHSRNESEIDRLNISVTFLNYVFPIILIGMALISIRVEISQFWSNLQIATSIEVSNGYLGKLTTKFNPDLRHFKKMSMVFFSMFSLMGLTTLNLYKLKLKDIAKINFALNLVGSFFFLFVGLWHLSELRVSYLDTSSSQYFDKSGLHIGLRYVFIACFALFWWFTSKYNNWSFSTRKIRKGFTLFSLLILLWIITSEYLHWMHMGGTSRSYKLGVSIVWGAYALLMVAYGIWKRKRFIRIAAIALFGLTLVKLFVFDIVHLETIPKTIIFISLGLFLLIISFMYNKYVDHIDYENQELKLEDSISSNE